MRLCGTTVRFSGSGDFIIEPGVSLLPGERFHLQAAARLCSARPSFCRTDGGGKGGGGKRLLPGNRRPSYQIVIKQVVKCDRADKQQRRTPAPLHEGGCSCVVESARVFFVLKKSRVCLSSQHNAAGHPENIRARRFYFEKQEVCTNRVSHCVSSHLTETRCVHCPSCPFVCHPTQSHSHLFSRFLQVKIKPA